MEARPVPRTGDEIFKFLAATFCVTRAKELVDEGRARLVTIDPHDFESIIGMIRIDQKRVPKADTSVPGVMVRFAIPQADRPAEIFTLLIDGWHRAQKLLQEGETKMQVHFFDDPDYVMEEFAWIRGVRSAPGKYFDDDSEDPEGEKEASDLG